MSSNRKVYARQVPWEWQESPWDDEQLKIDKAAPCVPLFRCGNTGTCCEVRRGENGSKGAS